MKRKIEILAPAGSYEGMLAALNAGCDAIYIGGSMFGARAYANNLDTESLLRAIDETHIRGKHLYLTVNTLLKEEELCERLYEYIKPLYEEGLDAVIVQDVGVMNFIHRNFGDLQIHASTQTTIAMAEGLELLQNMNVTRMVTPRELSLEEIRDIREKTKLEIETFVHGALCYCYSGQCLMSSIIGGRSGNRGRCAQSCRMPYKLNDKTGYFLSPKDICTLDMIPELVEAGIDSFKIEGRMKRPEYAAKTANLYRKYTDWYLELGKERYAEFMINHEKELRQDLMDLQDIYNRGGFSKGYFLTHNAKGMMALNRPNHSGVEVGKVVKQDKSMVEIQLKEDVFPQDVLEIRDKEASVYEFTVKEPTKANTVLKVRIGSYVIKGKDKREKRIDHKNVKTGCIVYRMKKEILLKSLSEAYMQKNTRTKITGELVAIAGQPLALTFHYGTISATVTRDIVEPASRQPMTEKRMKEQIVKLTDTYFDLGAFTVNTCGNAFVPVSVLNELRRDCVALLTKKIIDTFHRSAGPKIPLLSEEYYEAVKGDVEIPGIVVTVSSLKQFEKVLTFAKVDAVYLDTAVLTDVEIKQALIANDDSKRIYLMLPHICRKETYHRLKQYILSVKENNISGYVIKNFEEYTLLKEIYKDGLAKLDIITNHNLYIYNHEAKDFYLQRGLKHFTAPLELNSNELIKISWEDSDFVVYGYLPVMISAQCLVKNSVGCKKDNEKNSITTIEDRRNKKFTVRTNCRDCYNAIFNSDVFSLAGLAEEVLRLRPKAIRIDFTFEDEVEVKTILEQFIQSYYELKTPKLREGYTTGHFRRGVE